MPVPRYTRNRRPATLVQARRRTQGDTHARGGATPQDEPRDPVAGETSVVDSVRPSLLHPSGAPLPAAHAPLPAWRDVLPALERELSGEIAAFRKRMLSAHALPDYRNDMIRGRRSGAWEILSETRNDGGDDIAASFAIYVRRGRDQLAVWEGPGDPDSLRANFSTAFPGPLLDAGAVREGLSATLVRRGVLSR